MGFALHLRNVVTAGVIGTAGDSLMQHREGVTALDDLDIGRTARLVSFRMVHAPLIDAAWRFFDHRIPFGGVAGVVARVAADQGLLMPPSLVGFFLSQGAMEGCSPKECVQRVRDSFVPAASKAIPYWCAVHSLTFSVVTPRYRMAWASMCAVAWNAIMSHENQNAILREQGSVASAEANSGGSRSL